MNQSVQKQLEIMMKYFNISQAKAHCYNAVTIVLMAAGILGAILSHDRLFRIKDPVFIAFTGIGAVSVLVL